MGSNKLYFCISFFSFFLYSGFLIFTLWKTHMKLDRSSLISLAIYLFYFSLSFINWIANLIRNGSIGEENLSIHSNNDLVFRFIDLNIQFILILIQSYFAFEMYFVKIALASKTTKKHMKYQQRATKMRNTTIIV